MRRILAIANPISGRGHAARLVPKFEELARLTEMTIDMRMTEAPGHGKELAAAARETHDAVFAVGGDGTVNEIVNGLGPGGPPLAVIPQGTGNVLAKEIGASSNPLKYAGTLKRWNVKKRDLGRLSDGRLFACFVGAGFDGQCTRAFEERKGSIRMAQYVPIMWKAIRHADFTTLVVDGDRADEHHENVSYALVSITPAYGGPLWLTAKALPDDGRFDVLTVHERISPLTLMKLVGYAFLKKMGRAGSTKFFRAARVKVRADEEVPIQIDGDFAGFLPVEAEILPGALGYFTPGG